MTRLPFFGVHPLILLSSAEEAFEQLSASEATWLVEYLIHIICPCGRGHPHAEESREREQAGDDG